MSRLGIVICAAVKTLTVFVEVQLLEEFVKVGLEFCVHGLLEELYEPVSIAVVNQTVVVDTHHLGVEGRGFGRLRHMNVIGTTYMYVAMVAYTCMHICKSSKMEEEYERVKKLKNRSPAEDEPRTF